MGIEPNFYCDYMNKDRLRMICLLFQKKCKINITRKNIESNSSVYSLGITYLIVELILTIYFIRLSKNKKKSDEQENIYQDERINENRNMACSITFKIIISLSLMADYIVTFFLEQYQELANELNAFIGFIIVIYLMSYFFISKRN